MPQHPCMLYYAANFVFLWKIKYTSTKSEMNLQGSPRLTKAVNKTNNKKRRNATKPGFKRFNQVLM